MSDIDAAFWTWLARGCRKTDLAVLMHASLQTPQSAGSQDEEIKTVAIQMDSHKEVHTNDEESDDDSIFEPYEGDADEDEKVKVVRIQ